MILFSCALGRISKADGFKVENHSSKYFPGGIYSDFVIRWYSKHLSAMDEPSLFGMSKSSFQETYRFLLLPSFGKPICIRLTILDDGTGELVGKMTNGSGGGPPGILVHDATLKVTKLQVEDFRKKIESIGFWDMKTRTSIFGMDGERWIMEGIRNGKYHIVDRWTTDTKEIRIPALTLVHLAKMN